MNCIPVLLLPLRATTKETHLFSRREAHVKLEQDCIQLQCQEDDPKSATLNKTPSALQWIPLVFVSMSWRELRQCPFHLKKAQYSHQTYDS